MPRRAIDCFLTEASLGCLMAVLPPADAAPLCAWAHEKIAPCDLAGDGFEASPHVTLAYGFQPGVSPLDMQQAVNQWARTSLRFTLGPLARFDTSAEYDVLYASVKFDSDLRELHDHLTRAFGARLKESFPTYVPHLCVAYLRKGACPNLTGHAQWDDSTYALGTLVYSLPESVAKFPIVLGQPEKPVAKVLPEHARRAQRSVAG